MVRPIAASSEAERPPERAPREPWIRPDALLMGSAVVLVGVIVAAAIFASLPKKRPAPKVIGEQVETWDAVFIKGTKVGHVRTLRETIEEEGKRLVHTKSQMAISIDRAGASVSQEVESECVETEEGELIRFVNTMTTGSQTVRSEGEVASGTLYVVAETAGKSERLEIPWHRTIGGYFAPEAWLRKSPMKPGENREFRALQPITNQIGEYQLKSGKLQSTPLLSGEKELLPIATTIRSGGTTMDSRSWCDSNGETLKSELTGFGMTIFRCTREEALARSTGPRYDILAATLVKVSKPLNDPHATREVVYRIRLQEGDVSTLFPAGATQSLSPLKDGFAEVRVRSISATDPATVEPRPTQPTDADLNPSRLIQSDDAKVIELADSVVPQEKNPVRIALALEKLVRQSVRNKGFAQAFDSAAEVAASGEGDCTEHAVLLAAVCRARGIPARTAVGLVYSPVDQAFAYHMWTEAWTGDRWLPLDGTLGQGGIGAAHLKIAESNLAGANAYNILFTLFQALGRLEIEIVSVK